MVCQTACYTSIGVSVRLGSEGLTATNDHFPSISHSTKLGEPQSLTVTGLAVARDLVRTSMQVYNGTVCYCILGYHIWMI